MGPTEWDFEGANISGYRRGNPTVVVSKDDPTRMIFHPISSSGTAAIRSAHPLTFNRHHFFEIEMLSKVYGTDVMIGIGTSDAAIDNHSTSFVSLIGIDKESWGFSYRGDLQHNGYYNRHNLGGGKTKRGPRGARYSKETWREGSLIGCHFNGFRGTLEFYQNRVSLGLAFTIPKMNPVYPMVSSTAAKLSVRLTASFSHDSNLQFDSAIVLCRRVWIDDKIESELKSFYVRNNQPGQNRLRHEKMRALEKSLPPGLVGYVNRNCWFAMGCKFEDVEEEDAARGFELEALSSDDDEVCKFQDAPRAVKLTVSSSDDDEVTFLSPSKTFKKLKSSLNMSTDGPGPSVRNFNEEDETSGATSIVVPKANGKKRRIDDSSTKPKRFMLAGALKKRRLSKD